jgi:hypothetical protein
MKIHPRRDVATLGSLAASTNSWYDNDKEKMDGEDDGDQESEEGGINVHNNKKAKLQVPTPSLPPAFPVLQRTISQGIGSRTISAIDILSTKPEILLLGQSVKTLSEIIRYAAKLEEVATSELKKKQQELGT